MIVVDKAKLQFLFAGRELTVDGPDRGYRRDRTYALGITHSRTVCRVQVLSALDGRLRIRVANMEAPCFLAARSEYGYTSDPAKGMLHEPEAVRPAEVEKITRSAHLRDGERSRVDDQRRHARSLAIRLKDAQHHGDADALARIRGELELLEQQIRKAA